MGTELIHRNAVCLAAALLGFALIAAGCTKPVPEALAPNEPPSVSDTVPLGDDGTVTFVSMTETPPADFSSAKLNPPQSGVWLVMEFKNTSEASVTIAGPRAAKQPSVQLADGSEALITEIGAQMENGGGGRGRGEVTPYLNPGGVLRASFGMRSIEASQVREVAWRPTGKETATFTVR